MPDQTTSATTQATNPAGDLDAEIKNLVNWSTDAQGARMSASCTSVMTGCQLW